MATKLNIFVPFANLRSATYVALPMARFIPLIGDYAYAEYFRDRWNDGGTFINVEHDVVPTMNVLESMWNCESPICTTGYIYRDSPPDFNPEVTYGGCIKVSKDFIRRHRDLWHNPLPRWSVCDGRITKAIEDNPYPGINGNDQHCYHGEVLHLHR